MKKAKRCMAAVLCAALALTLTILPGNLQQADAAQISLFDYSYTYEGTEFSYTVSDDEVTITGASSENTEIIVPESIDDAAVTAIDDGVFKGNTTLVSISLPDSITSIGESAFYGCTALESIDLPDSIKYIEYYTFYNCTSLTTVDFPENLQIIRLYAFYNCEKLESLTFPNSLSAIYEYAFANCPSITYICLPASDLAIRDNNFAQSTSVKTVEYAEGCTRPYTGDSWQNGTSFISCAVTLILPSTITSLATGSYGYDGNVSNNYFSAFSSLEEIIISDENEYYATYDGAIYDKDFTTLYIVPRGVSEIEIADTCITISEAAFSSCSRLTDITIPESVTTIEGSTSSGMDGSYGAFASCTSLTSIDIPITVTSIGSGALSGCSGLTDCTFYIDGVYYHFYGEDTLSELELLDGTSAATDDVDTSVLTTDWELTDACFDIFGTTSQGNSSTGAYSEMTQLVSISLPAGVTSLQSDLFDSMTSLESIEADESNAVYYTENGILYSYNDDAEDDSTASDGTLTLVRYPAALGYKTFADNLTVVGARAFYNCSGLSEVTFESALTTVEEQAFYKCSNMVFDFTESGLTTIGDQAFYNAFNSKVLLPDTVSSIGENAFYTTDDTQIVYGTTDSYVQTYCEENDITFRDITVYGTSADTDDTDSSDTTDEDTDEDSSDTDSSDTDDSSDADGSGDDNAASDSDTDTGDASDADSPSNTDSSSGADSSSSGSTNTQEQSGTNNSGSSSGSEAVVGSTYTVGKGVYKVTSASTVTFVKPTGKNLKSITIPATVRIGTKSYKVTAIAASAFAKNTKLKSVVIGKNVKTIGKKAFYNCKSLKKITFKGKKVKKIGAKAFKGTAKKAVVKTPKAKKAVYKKLLKKAGLSAKARIK